MYYIIYLIGIVLLLVKGIGTSNLAGFRDSTSLLCVVLPGLLMLFCTKSLKSFGECFLFMFGKRNYSLLQCRRCLQSIKMFILSSVISGFIGLMISIKNILTLLDSFEMLGLNIGVAILTIFYVLIIVILLLPVIVMLKLHIMNLLSEDGGKDSASDEAH